MVLRSLANRCHHTAVRRLYQGIWICLAIPFFIYLIIGIPGCRSDVPPTDPNQSAASALQSTDRLDPDAAPLALAFPDPRFNRLFTRSHGGWTGGDGTASVLLPDGRTLWLFGDTFLGSVRPDRTRPTNSPMIRNSFALQRDTDFITLYATVAGEPIDFVRPPHGTGWYWPGDATIINGCLWIFMHHFQATGTGMWDFQWIGTDMVAFDLPGIEQVNVIPVSTGNLVQYGAAVLEEKDYLYIYGTEDADGKKFAHAARIKSRRIDNSWQYFSKSGWSHDAGNTRRLLPGVANQFSVVPAGRQYLLISTDTRVPFGSQIAGYLSPTPVGPWRGPITIYTAPEAQGDVIAYNAFVHSQFSDGDLILVSYNLNHIRDTNAIFENADWYRPKFIRVDLRRLLALFHVEEIKQK